MSSFKTRLWRWHEGPLLICRQATAASESIRVHAGKLSKDAQPEAISSAKAEVEQALQYLIDIIEEKRGVE